MKRTTLMAIVAAIVGAVVVAYFATRPRPPTSALPDDGAEADPAAAQRQRTGDTVRGVGAGLAGIAGAIAEAAS